MEIGWDKSLRNHSSHTFSCLNHDGTLEITRHFHYAFHFYSAVHPISPFYHMKGRLIPEK